MAIIWHSVWSFFVLDKLKLYILAMCSSLMHWTIKDSGYIWWAGYQVIFFKFGMIWFWMEMAAKALDFPMDNLHHKSLILTFILTIHQLKEVLIGWHTLSLIYSCHAAKAKMTQLPQLHPGALALLMAWGCAPLNFCLCV